MLATEPGHATEPIKKPGTPKCVIGAAVALALLTVAYAARRWVRGRVLRP